MNLRLRLIVAFFLLSVVPLGAVTFYSYRSNAGALRDAAQHEAELLAGELTQRMQVVTAQLTERVGDLMDMNEAQPAAVVARNEPARPPATPQTRKPASTTPKPTASPAPKPATPAVSTPPETLATEAGMPTPSSAAINTKVAEALGEVAMLFNNIELRGLRGDDFRRGGGVPSGRGGTGGAQGRGANAGAFPGSGQSSAPRTFTDRTPGSAAPRAGARGESPATPNPPPTLMPSPPPGRVTQPLLPGVPPSAMVVGLDERERIRIDMAPILRDM